jgi:transposase
MPTRLVARPPADPAEARRLRTLAAARHAPASWIQRARIVTGSWDGATVTQLAERLGCTTKTIYKWLHRFNAAGLHGLGDLPRPGKPRRITEHERGRIIALARSDPPGRLVQGGDGLLAPVDPTAPATWTLDTLAEAAQAAGIQVARSQVRTILRAEGVRWRRTRSWITPTDVDFVLKEPPSSPAIPARRRKRPWSAPTSSAR